LNDTAIVELLAVQHAENMEVQKEQTRLLELLTAEHRVRNVRTAMLDETLKKVLVAITGFGGTAKELLEEFK